MVPDPERDAPADPARAIAERDTLFEVISIATHDLNNPLQSLVVLLELALDETVPGSEPHARTSQCLLAAERIRVLTGALGGFVRARPLDGPTLWTTSAALLGRRFDRYRITVEADVSALTNVAVPAAMGLVLVAAGVLVIGSAAAAGRKAFRLEVAGTRAPDAFTLRLVDASDDAPRAAIAWEPRLRARLCALADDSVRVEFSDTGVHLSANGT